MKSLLKLIFIFIIFSFVTASSHAQQRDEARAYGKRLFELLQSKNIQGLNELVPSYNLYINEIFKQSRRQMKQSGTSEDEMETALNEMHKEVAESMEAQQKFFAVLFENLKKEFLDLLDRGQRNGIVWKNIRFVNFKYKPDKESEFFTMLQGAKLLFSHQGEVFSLKVGPLVKLQERYYSLNIQFNELFQ